MKLGDDEAMPRQDGRQVIDRSTMSRFGKKRILYSFCTKYTRVRALHDKNLGLPPAMELVKPYHPKCRRGRAFATRRPPPKQRRAQTNRSIPQPINPLFR